MPRNFCVDYILDTETSTCLINGCYAEVCTFLCIIRCFSCSRERLTHSIDIWPVAKTVKGVNTEFWYLSYAELNVISTITYFTEIFDTPYKYIEILNIYFYHLTVQLSHFNAVAKCYTNRYCTNLLQDISKLLTYVFKFHMFLLSLCVL